MANQVGGNDDLLFDGNSLVAWPDGRVVIAPAWKEGILMVDLDDPDACTWLASTSADALDVGQDQLRRLQSGDDGREHERDVLEDLADAVITGLSDYCRK
jgi:NAD+ synthase (glutamine-hydrolysing)